MLGWIILIVLLLLILLMPVGADIMYSKDVLTLKLKAGPLYWKLFPGKRGKPPDKQAGKNECKKEKKSNKDKKLTIKKDDFAELLKILFRTLRRLRKHLSIDLLQLKWIAAAGDPYDTVMQFGALNAGLSAVLPLAESVLKIREKDISSDLDFAAQDPWIEARVIATLQIWELLLIAVCAGAAAAVWYLKKRKQARSTENTAARKERNHG